MLLLAPAYAFAQNPVTINGRVTSSAGGPLPFAEISIPTLGVGALTRDDGRYAIFIPAARVSGQSVQMTVRRLGYKPQTVTVQLTQSLIAQDFTLATNPLQLGEVVVTGAGTAQTAEKLGNVRNAVPAEQIEKSNEQNVVEALAAKTAPPQSEIPPPSETADSAALVQVVTARPVPIDVGSCLGRAWDKMMTDLWTIIGISALVWIALSASHAVYVGIIITGPLLGGLYFYYLKKIRGQTAELQDAFAGFTLAFVQLLLASVVSGALIALGLALCVIPGIYLAVAWCFALPLIMDKQLSFWDAMELSRKTVNQNWWSVLWLIVVCGLINFGGGLLCCVGIFFTLPLTGLAMMYAYHDVFGTIPAKSA